MQRFPFLITAVLALPAAASAQQCAITPAPGIQPIPMATAHAAPLPAPFDPAAIAASPALRRLASRGAQLRDLGEQHGLRGVFAQSGPHFRIFYLTPDGTAEIGGVMWDASGHDVTRDQVAMIPGVIPTLTWTPKVGARTIPATADAEATVDPYARLAGTAFGVVGTKTAPRVFMVIDPLCPFSQRALAELRPAIDAGKIQIALVPIAINDWENSRASTPAATSLIAAGPVEMGTVWREIIRLGHAPDSGPFDPAASASLTLNLAAAHAIRMRGTPTLVWHDRDGASHVSAGLPDDLPAFLARLRP